MFRFAQIAAVANCSGVDWIWNTFGQCVETNVEYAAFVIGFVSFILWLFPVIPQIYQNFKRGHCDDALSIYFLLFWFVGDSLNLSGAILSSQLPIQVYTGVYFIVQDCLILGQYFYFKVRSGWRLRMLHDLGRPTLSCLMIFSVVGCFNNSGPTTNSESEILLNLRYDSTGKFQMKPFFVDGKDAIGYIFGSISAFCYLAGRVPQLYKNLKRKSTDGVSISMFIIIICANFTYGLSVLLSGDTALYVLHHLPWLVGSFTCCLLDCIVLYQYSIYNKKRGQIAFVNDLLEDAPVLNASIGHEIPPNDDSFIAYDRNDSTEPIIPR